MAWCGISRELRRSLIDFAIALVCFWGVALAFGTYQGKAHAVPLPALTAQEVASTAGTRTPASLHSAAAMQVDQQAEEIRVAQHRQLLLLSLTCAGLIAFNLAFVRHLRRAYASPRRGGWRRG